MAYRCISADLKECALRLWEAGWTIEDICETLQVSRASLYHWDQIFQQLGDVERPPSPLRGPARILTRALLTACQDIFTQESDLFLDEVVLWLALVHNIQISTATLSRNLQELGLTHKLLHKIAAKRDELRCQEFRQMIHEELLSDGSQGRAMSGERAELIDVFVHGDCYSVVAAMTTDGYIAADVTEGSYDTELFNNFIIEKVLPQTNPFPAERSVLLLDNCCIHHNDELVELVMEAGES
ncbi:hypothetical protein BDN67DRAFT_867015, partial [Paxillus ammoniavirescens]